MHEAREGCQNEATLNHPGKSYFKDNVTGGKSGKGYDLHANWQWQTHSYNTVWRSLT